MTIKSVIALLIFLAIGGGLIFYGINNLRSDHVTCGGQTMSRGDMCSTTSNGVTTRRTYEDEKDQSKQGDQIAIIIGGLTIALALVFTVAGARRRHSLRGAPQQFVAGQQPSQ